MERVLAKFFFIFSLLFLVSSHAAASGIFSTHDTSVHQKMIFESVGNLKTFLKLGAALGLKTKSFEKWIEGRMSTQVKSSSNVSTKILSKGLLFPGFSKPIDFANIHEGILSIEGRKFRLGNLNDEKSWSRLVQFLSSYRVAGVNRDAHIHFFGPLISEAQASETDYVLWVVVAGLYIQRHLILQLLKSGLRTTRGIGSRIMLVLLGVISAIVFSLGIPLIAKGREFLAQHLSLKCIDNVLMVEQGVEGYEGFKRTTYRLDDPKFFDIFPLNVDHRIPMVFVIAESFNCEKNKDMLVKMNAKLKNMAGKMANAGVDGIVDLIEKIPTPESQGIAK